MKISKWEKKVKSLVGSALKIGISINNNSKELIFLYYIRSLTHLKKTKFHAIVPIHRLHAFFIHLHAVIQSLNRYTNNKH